MTKVLYPGSFDPITKGHMNIINQASKLFDEVIVAVFQNSAKGNGFFTLEERFEIIKELYKEASNINVILGSGTSVNTAALYECKAIVRGLRSLSDFEFEIQLQQMNKDFSDNKINTVCLFADNEYQFVSSSMVREAFKYDQDISRYVDPLVKDKMLEKRLK